MFFTVMTITLKLLSQDVIFSEFNERAHNEFLFLSLRRENCVKISDEIKAHSLNADFIINAET